MKILDFIAAEDIRIEIGNKHSLIGIYSEKVVLPIQGNITWPFPLRLAVFIRISKEQDGNLVDCLNLEILHNGKLIVPVKAPLGPPTESPSIIIAANMNPFPLPGPGILDFNLQLLSRGTIVFSQHGPFPIDISVQNIAQGGLYSYKPAISSSDQT